MNHLMYTSNAQFLLFLIKKKMEKSRSKGASKIKELTFKGKII